MNKRPLVFLFLIILLIPVNNLLIIPNLISFTAFRDYFVEPVTFTFKMQGEKKPTVYRTNGRGESIEIKNIYDSKVRKFMRGIHIALNSDQLKALQEISVRMRDVKFTYNKYEFIKNWRRVDQKLQDKVVYYAPETLKSESVVPNLLSWNKKLASTVNYTPHLLLSLLKVFLLLLFLWLIFTVGKLLLRNSDGSEADSKIELISFKGRGLNNKFYYLVFFIIYLLASLYFARLDIDAHHQGFLFLVAQRMAEGKILFKEIYFHYGILTAFLHLWAIKIFGQKLLVINSLSAVFYGLNIALFYPVTLRFLKQKTALLVTILWALLSPFLIYVILPWSSVYSLFFLMLTLFIALKYFEDDKDDYKYLLALGITSGLCFWARQSVGPLVVFGVFLSFFLLFYFNEKQKIISIVKKLSTFSIGFIIISIPFVVWLYSHDAMTDWYIQNFKGQGEWAYGGSLFRLKIILKIIGILFPLNFWGYMPVASIFIFVALVRKFIKRGPLSLKEKQLFVLVAFAMAGWAQYFPVPGTRHYFWAAPPMFILFSVFIFSICLPFLKNHFSNRKASLGVIFLISLLISPILNEFIMRAPKMIINLKVHRYTVTDPLFLRGMKVAEQDTVDKLKIIDQKLAEYVAKYPETSIACNEPYNQLFMSFIKNSKLPGPLHSAAFNFGFLNKTYDFERAQKRFLKEERPIIFSHKVINMPDYKEYFHIKFKEAIDYQAGIIYFYIPVENSKS